MRKFVVTVNGEQYEVVVEEKGDGVQVAAPTPVAAKPAPAAAPASKPAPAPHSPSLQPNLQQELAA